MFHSQAESSRHEVEMIQVYLEFQFVRIKLSKSPFIIFKAELMNLFGRLYAP